MILCILLWLLFFSVMLQAAAGDKELSRIYFSGGLTEILLLATVTAWQNQELWKRRRQTQLCSEELSYCLGVEGA